MRGVSTVRSFTALAIAACFSFSLVACDNKPSPQTNAKPAETARAEPVTPASTQAPVAAVDSVIINRPQDAPGALIIAASGTVNSSGWTDAKLLSMDDQAAGAETKSYRFVATSPANGNAMPAAQPVEAQLRIDALPPNVRNIRIVAAGNEVTANLGTMP